MPTKEERTSAAIVKEYELMALSPREVHDAYKERYEDEEKYRWNDDVDAWTDEALWARNEPLIKLAIAKYGKNTDISKEILRGNEKALKYSMLSHLKNYGFGEKLPNDLFESKEELKNYIASCPDEEIIQLLKNPHISRNFLENFFEQDEIWKACSEDRQMLICREFGSNPIAKEPYDKSYMDGFAEWSYGKLFQYAWRLCDKVPVNKGWALSLERMTANLLPGTFGSPFENKEKTLEVIKRWFPVGEELSEYDDEGHYKELGHLSSWQRLRSNLARLITDRELKKNSEDIAIRCQYYESEWLSPEEMKTAFEKDGLVAFNSMLWNERLWTKQARRQALHDLAWAADDIEGKGYLDNANHYNSFEERYQKEHPNWFAEEDDGDDTEPSSISDADLPVNRQYIYDLAEVIVKQNNQTQNELANITKQLKIILYVVAGIAVFLIFKFN